MQAPTLYHYSSLKHPDEIRLLRFSPAGPTEERATDLRIEIFHARLGSKPTYNALSYTWGQPSNPVSIACNDGCILLITQNCASALCRLRKDDTGTPLWIDAICIDQENLAERSQQVSIMRDIYRFAQQVIIYLGEREADDAVAMQYLSNYNREEEQALARSKLRPGRAVGTFEVDLSSPIPRALQVLYRRPWFERVWVLQEANWAKDAKVLCGEYKVCWSTMKIACQAVIIQRKFGFKNAVEPPAILRIISGISMVHHVDSQGNLLQRLHETRCCKATDPRDKIFALLSTGYDAALSQSELVQQSLERRGGKLPGMLFTFQWPILSEHHHVENCVVLGFHEQH
jgi:hypothetical protein